MLSKFCKCGKQIPITSKSCKECEAKRNKMYDKTKRKYRDVYHNAMWNPLREQCRAEVNGIDLFILATEGKIVQGNTAHHIIEVEEDISKAFDVMNLFWITDKSHKKIHALYNKDEETKRKTQEGLLSLKKLYLEGDIGKVFPKAHKTCAPLYLRENARNENLKNI